MSGLTDRGPFLKGQHFFVESDPVPYGAQSVSFRFAFDTYGPHVDMKVGDRWSIMRDYTHYGLAPEDIPQITIEDLKTLVELFERSIEQMSPGVAFVRGVIPPSARSSCRPVR